MKQDQEDTRTKRAIRWLSGSVGVSLTLHLLLTVGLGLAVITISQPVEPIRITSSNYEESETLEAPVELEQVEELEVTEVSTQMVMPAVTSDVSAATSNLAVSDSAIGAVTAPNSNGMGAAISQAWEPLVARAT